MGACIIPKVCCLKGKKDENNIHSIRVGKESYVIDKYKISINWNNFIQFISQSKIQIK